ncbi:MAG TPA: winged helix-turn-helix domain-containing protein, partial [Candidatus Sulfotelmatobacter sp.]|nr:winged helix-turn-helix domain-containing protein [Candidatus Sulfotelmatobacter sp.]
MPLPSKVHSVYRFGVFELDADTGELRRNGSRLRLQDQPYHVLLKLLEHAGQTVTRDELRKTLWPADTFVDFETGLNTTIKRLRETLKDSAENPAFIETVPKRGYRFIAPVSTQVAGPETKADKATPFSHVRVNRFVLLGAVLILALLPVGFALRRWDTQLSLPARVLDFAQLTNDSQAKQGRLLSDGYRIYFSEVLPVGRIVAQVSAKGGETTTIPSSVLDPRPVDLSPDGTELLILSGGGSKSEEPHGDTLWILPVAGGSGRPVGNILATDALWGERGETILYCDGHDLYSVNRDGSNQRKLLTLSGYVESLRWSPDRHFVRFTMTTRNMGRTSSIWEVSANGTGLRQIVPGIPGSVACCGVWMAGTDQFLFQWTRAGRSDLWETSGSHSVLRPGPTRLTAGPMSYSEPAASGLRNEVFVVGSIPRAELVKYVADKAELVPYLSGISAEGVEVSRDGQSVAYTLYPEGTLWRSNIAGSERVQLTFAPMRAFLPRWSPDGKQIAFMGTVNGEHWTTYIISAQGGLARQMIPGDDETADATWMPSNRTIIFGPWSNSRSRGIKALDLDTNQVSPIPGATEMWSPRTSPDGRYIAALSQSESKMMLFDNRTKKWEELSDDYSGYPSWSRDGNYLYFQDWNHGSGYPSR